VHPPIELNDFGRQWADIGAEALDHLRTWRDPEIGSLYERRGWVTSPSMLDGFPRTRARACRTRL